MKWWWCKHITMQFYSMSFHSHMEEASKDFVGTATFSNFQARRQNSIVVDEIRQMPKPSLFLALARAFGWPFAIAGFLKFISDLLSFVGPQVLKWVTFFVQQFYNQTTDGSLSTHKIKMNQNGEDISMLCCFLCLQSYSHWCYNNTSIVVLLLVCIWEQLSFQWFITR